MPTGSSGGGGKSQSGPWGGQAPFLSQVYQQAQGLYPNALPYYPHSTVAPQGQGELMASEQALARGASGNPALDAAEQMLTATARGDYLTPDSNPALADYYQAAAGQATRAYQRGALPALEARFGGAGRTNSPGYMAAHARESEGFGRNLTDLAAQIYAPAYEAERGRQMGAAGLAPAFAAEDWRDVGQLRASGMADRAYGQDVLNDLIARHEYERDEPWLRLDRYRAMLGEPVGMSKGTTPGSGGSTAQSIVGGVTSLASIGLMAYALSTKEAKDEVGPVDVDAMLEALAKLPVQRWRYKAVAQIMEDATPEHVGPYAEDFTALTGLGDGKTLAYVDALGVLFSVVGELARRELARREGPA